MYTEYMQSPIGTIEISASEQGISYVLFVNSIARQENISDLTRDCKQQLGEYFQGKREDFELPLDQSGTQFQKHVWMSLCDIPFGTTWSYSELAKDIGNPKAVRAVGAANGKNPISIIVPCHRVIGSDNTLTGYAGGINRKAWLLRHEGCALACDIQEDMFAF